MGDDPGLSQEVVRAPIQLVMVPCRQGGPGNIAQLLLSRETGGLRGRNLSVGQTPSETRCALGRWTENDFMRHCSGHYVEFKPVPRSTIASSFSPNGALLASTQ